MANVSPNARRPNVTIIPLTHIGSIGVCVRSSRVFRYQHVGIPNAKCLRWGSKPMRRPNVNGFALQWNIGLRVPNL